MYAVGDNTNSGGNELQAIIIARRNKDFNKIKSNSLRRSNLYYE